MDAIGELWVARPPAQDAPRTIEIRAAWDFVCNEALHPKTQWHDWSAGPMRVGVHVRRAVTAGGLGKPEPAFSIITSDNHQGGEIFTFDVERIMLQGKHPAIRVVCERVVVHFEAFTSAAMARKWGWDLAASPDVIWPTPGGPDDIQSQIDANRRFKNGERLMYGMIAVPADAVHCRRANVPWHEIDRWNKQKCPCTVCEAMRRNIAAPRASAGEKISRGEKQT